MGLVMVTGTAAMYVCAMFGILVERLPVLVLLVVFARREW